MHTKIVKVLTMTKALYRHGLVVWREAVCRFPGSGVLQEVL